MKFWLPVLLGVLLASCSSKEPQPDWVNARNAVVSFSVTFETTTAMGMLQVPSKMGWTGTGWLVSPDGYIVTCAHVVDAPPGADISVEFYGVPGMAAHPRLIYLNRTFDIALLKLDLSQPIAPYFPLGRVDEVQQGDGVYVMGHPDALKWTAFKTMVSAKRFIAQNRPDDSVVEPYMLQLQDPMAPGISGSPVLDSKGRVVCMVDWVVVPSRMAEMDFCIPVDEIRWMLDSLGIGNVNNS